MFLFTMLPKQLNTIDKKNGKPKDVAERRKRRSCGTSSEVSTKKSRSSKLETQHEVIIGKKTNSETKFALTSLHSKVDRRSDITEKKIANKKENQTLAFDENKKQNKLLGKNKEKTETVTSLGNLLGQDPITIVANLDAGMKAASQDRKTHSKDNICNEIDTEWKLDAKAWDMCFAKNDKNKAQRLIRERILPDHEMLNKASTAFENDPQTLKNLVDEISSYIKARSNKFINVYAGYEHINKNLAEENALVFAVVTSSNIDFENEFGYTIEQICTHEVNSSPENKEIELKEREYTMNEDEIIKAEKVMTLHSKELMKMHKNITRISVSWVKSTNFGRADAEMRNEVCVSLYVPKKGLIPIEENPFPKELDGFSVDVREGVCVPLLGSYDVHTNIKIGCAISGQRISDESFFGTIGGFFERNKRVYGLTCAHLFLQNPNIRALHSDCTWEATDLLDPSNYVYQPSPITEPFGYLTKAVFTSGDINTSSVEAAVFVVLNRHPNSGIFPDAEKDHKSGYGEKNPLLFNSGKLSENVKRKATVLKHGITTGITTGRFRARSSSFRMSFTQNCSTELCNLYEVDSCGETAFAEKGDSGAMVFIVDGNELIGIGIVEGGMGNVCFVTPIFDVFRALGIPPPFAMKQFVIDDDTKTVCSGRGIVSNHQEETTQVENKKDDKPDNSNRVMSQDIAKQMEKVRTKIDQQLLQFKTELHGQNEQLCTDLEKKMKDMHKESYDQIQTMMNQLLKTGQNCS